MPRKAVFLIVSVLAAGGLLVYVLHLSRQRRETASSPALAMSLSNTTYRVSELALGDRINRVVVTIRNTGAIAGSLQASLRGDDSFQLRPGLSCPSTLAAGGTCSFVVSFAPVRAGTGSAMLDLRMSNASGTLSRAVRISGAGIALAKGQSLLTGTPCPVVAAYTWQPPESGKVEIEFGTGRHYGQTTSAYAWTQSDSPARIFVAGILQNTTYHMRARLIGRDGSVHYDSDHTFTTGSFPASILPSITTHRTGYGTPQPGIDLDSASYSTRLPGYLEAYATNLDGQLIWGYNFADRTKNTIVQPVVQMPNGNMLLVISYASQFKLPNPFTHITPGDESVDLLREINLAGDPQRQITVAQLNSELAAAGYHNIVIQDLHHEITLLPDGHLILIGSLFRDYRNLPGRRGVTHVLGDALIDLDQNFHVSWVWNSFDHLDINRHPIEFPDWTHTNAVLYSPNDGDLLVSMRHQSWILKLNYENGKGNGNIIWRLGYGGDFTLAGAVGPEYWFYGQHQPSFVGDSTSGRFTLTMMDNGFGRRFPNGQHCGDRGGPHCYTTIPIVDVNEADRIATIPRRVVLSPKLYSVWGGSADVLPNGDLEYDLCAEPSGVGSRVDEVRFSGGIWHTVWSMRETGASLYRSHRIPSLYPSAAQ